MTGPDQIWAFDYDLQDNDGTWRNWQCWSDSDPKPLNAAQYVRRDPAVLAALPEVQALIAAAVESGARRYRFGGGVHGDYPMWRYSDAAEKAIRAVAPADATAALARIEREAEARGRVKGLREAAEICHKHSYSNNPYVSKRMADAAAEILARADQIEKDGK